MTEGGRFSQPAAPYRRRMRDVRLALLVTAGALIVADLAGSDPDSNGPPITGAGLERKLPQSQTARSFADGVATRAVTIAYKKARAYNDSTALFISNQELVEDEVVDTGTSLVAQGPGYEISAKYAEDTSKTPRVPKAGSTKAISLNFTHPDGSSDTYAMSHHTFPGDVKGYWTVSGREASPKPITAASQEQSGNGFEYVTKPAFGMPDESSAVASYGVIAQVAGQMHAALDEIANRP